MTAASEPQADDGDFETYVHSLLYPTRRKLVCEVLKCFKNNFVTSFDKLKLITIVTKHLREEVISHHLIVRKEIAFKELILLRNLVNQKLQISILERDILTLKALSEIVTEKLKKAVDKHTEIKQRIDVIQHKLNNKTTVPLFDHKVADCLNRYIKNVVDLQKECSVLFCKTSRLYGKVNSKMNNSKQPASYLNKDQETAIKEELKNQQTAIDKLVTRIRFLKSKLWIYRAQQL